MKWTLDPHSDARLSDQIGACVRNGIASGDLEAGARLPPAAELAEALSVDRNTVLVAYRALRDEGLLEFRRGRGVRVTSMAPDMASLIEQARALVATARSRGVTREGLVQMIKELS